MGRDGLSKGVETKRNKLMTKEQVNDQLTRSHIGDAAFMKVGGAALASFKGAHSGVGKAPEGRKRRKLKSGDDSDSVDMAASDSDMEDEQEDDSDAEPAAKKARNTEPAGGVPPQDDLPKTLEPQKKMTQSLHLFFF